MLPEVCQIKQTWMSWCTNHLHTTWAASYGLWQSRGTQRTIRGCFTREYMDSVPSLVEYPTPCALSLSYLPRHYQATKNLYDIGNRLQACRDAILSPIYENGCKHDPHNYRPVSITSIACKILEHNLSSAMMPHLDTCGILTGEQHGIKKGLSAETQLADVHHWSHILHKGSRTDALLIDFSKAFEPVPQSRLPDKLRYYGIAGKTNKDIKGLLYNHRQSVVVNGSSSHWTPVPSGIPTE